MLDIFILVISAAVAVLAAFITNALNSARLLVPTDPDTPVPEKGEPVLYRFTTLGKLKDASAWKPRAMLAVILFVLFALLAKILVSYTNGTAGVGEDWTVLLWGMAIIASIGIVIAGALINLIALYAVIGIPMAIAEYVSGGVNAQYGMMWMGLAGGLMHLYAGIFISLNYRSMLHRALLELKHGQTIDGQQVRGWGRRYRIFYIWFLRLLPLAVLYQVIVYWWPDVEITRLVVGESVPQPLVIAVSSISLGMALNIALFIVPLFRELLEKSNLQGAADFTDAVRKRHEMQGEGREIPEDDDPVKGFVGAKGEWLSFQHEQVMPMVMIAAVLALNSVGQAIGKGLSANLAPPVAAEGGISLIHVASILAAMAFWTNAMFILGLASMLDTKGEDDNEVDAMHDDITTDADDTDDEFDAAEVNALVAWQAARNPDLLLTCYEFGGDPRVRIAIKPSEADGEGAADDPDDPDDDGTDDDEA